MGDLSSSPDPLGDEPPSSAHSFARRTGNTLTNHELSTISIPRTIPRNIQLETARKTSPSRRSPRKQTIELDVGNELSPQKILVTVEAEEALKRGINRRLFPSSSPVRGDYRKEAITTTTVPLNDEIVNESTPRRRGRPRRTSNGTPMPRGKKRAGTPIQTASRRTRKKGDPEFEIGIMDDTPSGIYKDSAESKTKTKTRKTPKRASTAQTVPSSQLSNATKKKRGRPRKTLMPEQVAVLADMGDQSNVDVANNDTVRSVQEQSQNLPPPAPSSALDIAESEAGRQEMTSDARDYLSEGIMGGIRSTPTPADVSHSYRTERARQNRRSPTTSYQEGLGDEDFPMDDGYPTLMEQHSDVESDFDVPHSGQDTLAHASDFSMIAVESLPSFQANRSAFPTDPPDMGDETNQIINETLESLRNSLRTEEASRQSPRDSNRDKLPAEKDRSVVPEGSLAEVGDNSLLGRPRSPRRPKQLPLSRQVFSGKAPHVDDSFSSIPDSILRAATPGRLPMKATTANDQHEDSGAYDDSFSEIPEAILEAATPRPAARTAAPMEESHAESSAHQGQVSSVNRHTGSNFLSSRLPTPDDTSSSNAGSKKAQEDDAGPSTAAPSVAAPTSNSGFQSSPPIMNRPRAMDFGPSQPDQEINNTPEAQSSPQLPPSAKEPKEPIEPAKSLEPPTYSRPSLSPIVRVGRTLQNVMSDRPSPEGRESSLGSPFRGPANNEPSQSLASNHSDQISIPKSPSRSNYGHPSQFNPRSLFNPNPTVAQSILSNFSHSRQPAQGDVIGNVSDPFGSDKPNHSQTEALRRTAYNNDDRVSQPNRSALFQSLASSTRAMPPSDDEVNWVGDSDNHQEVDRRTDSQTMRSQNSSIFATRGTSASQAMARNFESEEREVEREREDEHTQEPEDETNGEMTNYEDDADLWDFEASRPTPKRPERGRRTSQVNDQPTRRVKIPSPWRKTSRRLIYREEIASSSQIEIEENTQSEPEEVPPVRPRSRVSDVHSIILRRSPDSDQVDERTSYESEEEVQRSLLEIQEQPADPALENDHASENSMDHQEEPAEPAHESEYPMLHDREESVEPADASEPMLSPQEKQTEPRDGSEYSMVATQEKQTEPADASEYSILSPQEKQMEPRDVSEYSMLDNQVLDTQEKQNEPEPLNASEYSMLAQQKEDAPATQNKSVPSRSGLFGGFNILSFFSSPASLPKKVPEARQAEASRNIEKVAQPMFPRPVPRETEQQQQQPKEPRKSFWSAGLFPSIPQKEFQPSPERRNDLFSPAKALRSNDTVQDTYESPSPAPSYSPEPESPQSPEQSPQQSPEPSPHPSTPERQVYPPIEQKRNFTPRPGQSGGSLFRSGPSSARSDMTDDGLLLPPSDEFEQQESSLLTDGTEYERLPPREKPSRWDRTLSPSKSCFRSPMKPTTPGRVVAFKPSVLSPTAEPQHRAEAQVNVGNKKNNVLFQGPPLLQPTAESRDSRPMNTSSSHLFTRIDAAPVATTVSNSSAPRTNYNHNSAAQRPPRLSPSSTKFTLSQTEWSRQHWVRLDEMLQLRRRDPLAFQQQMPLPPRSQRKSFTTLLGKEVAAQGASIILEPWHLEVVEAFKKEVGGWDERALAKRVFALIVGEERRRKGLVGKNKGKESATAA
ncbi:hypothetical protein F5Y06DRAFT_186516 [Hypoxylon sp. FL0890]|nr:hypothetical protein F5Y06DRAFT_186516 [Hypoxylon sp. FL0890]